MAQVKFYRVETLPEIGEVGSLYFVYKGTSPKFYVCTSTGFEQYSDLFSRNFSTSLTDAIANSGDGVVYFTTDTHLIVKDGVIYGTGEDLTGEPGAPGESLQYNWEGTKLGVKTTSETEYVYTDLKGAKGDKGDTGETGADGAGIDSIAKTSTTGLVDTYTITYTDDSTSTFDITNGEKGEKGEQGPEGPQGPAGKDGTGVNIIGSFENPSELPSTGNNGDAYLIEGELWVWNGTQYVNTGSIQGPIGYGVYVASTNANSELIDTIPGIRIGDHILDNGVEDINRKGKLYTVESVSGGELNTTWVQKNITEISDTDDVIIVACNTETGNNYVLSQSTEWNNSNKVYNAVSSLINIEADGSISNDAVDDSMIMRIVDIAGSSNFNIYKKSDSGENTIRFVIANSNTGVYFTYDSTQAYYNNNTMSTDTFTDDNNQVKTILYGALSSTRYLYPTSGLWKSVTYINSSAEPYNFIFFVKSETSTGSTVIVSNSFVSLKGPQGETGQNGTPGAPGAPGTQVKINEDSSAWTMYEWLVSHDEGETWEGTGIIAQGEQGLQGETGPRGPEGPKGADGESIDSIVKTSTSGLVDTYTITYTDESTSTFDVTNGEKGNGFYAMTEEDIEYLIERLVEDQIDVNRGTIIDVLLSEANGEHGDIISDQGIAEGLYAYFGGPDSNYYLIDGYLIGNIVCEFEGELVDYVTYYEMHELKGEQGPAGESITITATTSSTEDGGANTVTFSDGTVLTVYNGKTGSDVLSTSYEAGQNISIQDGEISALGYTYDGVSTVDFGNNIVKFEQGSSIKEVDRSLAVLGDSGLNLLSDGDIKIASSADLVEISSAGDIKTTTDNGSIYMTAGTNIELKAEVIKLSTALVSSDLTVNGKVNASDGFFQTSDLNKKNVLSELDLNKVYELIDKCQTVLYTLKGSDDVQIGLIAQEVLEIFPELISETADGSLALDYSRLTVIILRVLKDLIVRIQNLESK